MGKSDEYIEYEAYIRYLKKVTGQPLDPYRLKRAVLDRSVEKTEMQTALALLKGLVAAAIVLLFALGAADFGLLSGSDDAEQDGNLWVRSREDDESDKGTMKLYNAYEYSKKLREKFS